MAEYSFKEPRFHDAAAAREYLESVRWPNGPVCPHCGAFDRITKLQGKSHRPGLYDCGHCRNQFTVTVGTVFERSKISLDKWVFAATLMTCSKKGVSSKQIERMLGVTYKTAWFMTHRLREAMKAPGGMLGGPGKIVEADETYYGRKPDAKNVRHVKAAHKLKIVTLVERDGGARSYHVADVTAATLKPILQEQISHETHVMTDAASYYRDIKGGFASHQTVNHYLREYAKQSQTFEGVAHTNTVESYFSLLKRGIYGTFHSVSEQHLQRYCTEFDSRYTHRQVKRKVEGQWQLMGPSDQERAKLLLKGISGKRLTYKRTNGAA